MLLSVVTGIVCYSLDIRGFFKGVVESARPLQRLIRFEGGIMVKLGVGVVDPVLGR